MAEDQYTLLLFATVSLSGTSQPSVHWLTDVDLTDWSRERQRWRPCLKEAGYDFRCLLHLLLKRAIHTLNHALDELDCNWLPVHKTWRLNERHHGALRASTRLMQLPSTARTVKIWRRSFDVQPPALSQATSAILTFVKCS